MLPGIRAAVQACGLKDGATISFHHHLRNGDAVLNQVVTEIAAMGLRDITPDLVDFVHRTEERVQCNAAGQVVLKLKTQFQRRLTCTQIMS